MSWVPVNASAWPSILALASRYHPALPEAEEVLRAKAEAAPEGCAVWEVEGKVLGYALAHPWTLGRVFPLNTEWHVRPEGPAVWYLHDLVLAPEARGRQASQRWVEHLRSLARTDGSSALALVAVYGSGAWWRRLGFRTEPLAAGAVLDAAYGEQAEYLVARI